MAINWDYNANDVEEGFPLLPQGDHRVCIVSAQEKTSKNGNDMIELKLEVSGQPGSLFYYLVFMPGNTTMTNTNLKRLWDSFGLAKRTIRGSLLPLIEALPTESVQWKGVPARLERSEPSGESFCRHKKYKHLAATS